VRHELERLGAVGGLRRTAEVVDRDRVDPRLGETLGELLVELVQTADVGHDDHAGTGRLFRAREVGAEFGSVGRGEDQLTLVGGSATYWGKGRAGVI